ncbi:GGDEF domain-containing protein [Fusibacter paucivorans]|uniref:GGDEF domain-containing protein n=1 Tax=Fusibacter paucivorans TaxID=76009 RepID=A0ABS5PPS9_9FIRM|nr:sensor domain-containing diguanylate cyclase [Fusibacter paucivorans]MBS7526912.1 GGDEF domain-containing protein [Fusibacter paucivorans]
MKNIGKKYLKQLMKLTMLFFIMFSFAVTVIAAYFQYHLNEKEKATLIEKETMTLAAEKATIYNKLNKITSDLLFLTDHLRLHDSETDDLSEVVDEWLAFSNRKQHYDQLRYIDVNGKEKIRIDYKDGGAEVVPENKLQNKQNRYYFKDTIGLNENDIYISPLDLNVENGVLEVPIKPMLRISMPYYDDRGEKAGIVIINYDANDMLDRIKSIASLSSGTIAMLNNDGYWLYHQDDPDLEWAFMYEDKQAERFANAYSCTWQAINQSYDGYVETSEGHFVFTKVTAGQDFLIDNAAYNLIMDEANWTLISMLAPASSTCVFNFTLVALVQEVLEQYFYLYLVALIIALLLASLMMVKQREKDQMRYFSTYDPMTGVFNRRAGFEKIKSTFQKHAKGNLRSSLCFIDINGLKEVNDNLGHEAGDELILSVVKVIEEKIGKTDFIIRLGGDEFLIVFVDLNLDEAEAVWQKIIDKFREINQMEDRRYVISASHGIEEIRYNLKEHIDSIVNKADEKMYEEKRNIKVNLKIIKDISLHK